LLGQIGLIALFDPKDIMTTMIMEGLDVGSIRTQAIFGDDKLEMRVVLTELGTEALGGLTLTIILLCTILCNNGFGHQLTVARPTAQPGAVGSGRWRGMLVVHCPWRHAPSSAAQKYF